MSQVPLLHPARWAWDYRQRTSVPFLLRPGDGVRTPLSGQVPTVGRTSAGYAFDRDGRMYRLPPGMPRIMMVDPLGGTGSKLRPAYVVEPSATYKVLQNESVGTSPWTVSNGALVGATFPVGALGLQDISDINATQIASFQQTIAGSAWTSTKVVVSLVVARYAGFEAATGALVQLRDTTLGVDRLVARINVGQGPVPIVTAVTGTFRGKMNIGARAIGGPAPDPTYLIALEPTTLTLANAHQLSIGGAAVATEVGAMAAGGYTISDAPFVAMPHEVAASNVTRQADTWNAPWGAPCRACTIYLDFINLGAHLLTGMQLLGLTDGSSNDPSLRVLSNGTAYRISHHNGSQLVQSAAPNPSADSFFQRIRLRCRLNADGSVQIRQRIGEGVEVEGPVSGGLPFELAGWGAGGMATSKIVIGPGPMLLLGAVIVWRDAPSERLDTYL